MGFLPLLSRFNTLSIPQAMARCLSDKKARMCLFSCHLCFTLCTGLLLCLDGAVTLTPVKNKLFMISSTLRLRAVNELLTLTVASLFTSRFCPLLKRVEVLSAALSVWERMIGTPLPSQPTLRWVPSCWCCQSFCTQKPSTASER